MHKETSSTHRAHEAYQTILKEGKGWYLAVKDMAKGAPYLVDTTTAFLFTKEAYAAEAAEALAGTVPLEVRKMEGIGVGLFNIAMCRHGITRVNMDMGQPHGGEGDRDEVLPVTSELYMGYRLTNSRLYALMLSCLQAKKSCAPQAADHWIAMGEAFRKGLFFVPVCTEEALEKEIEEECKQVSFYYFTYYTPEARARMQENKPSMDLVPFWRVVRAEGQPLRFIPISHPDNSKQYIPIFTDLFEAWGAVGKKTRLALIAYEDLKSACACYNGVVMNPATLNMVITAAGMENITQAASSSTSDWMPYIEEGWDTQPESEVYKFDECEESLQYVKVGSAPREEPVQEDIDEEDWIVQPDDPLEHFGQVLMKDVRDWSIHQYDRDIEYLEEKRYVQQILGGRKLDSKERELLRAIVPDVVDTVLHYMLFMLESNPEIELTIGGENLNEISDGLAGELYTEDGWIMRFSKERYEEP